VVADLAALLDHHDGELGAGRFRQLLEPDGAGERGGPASHEQDVDFERIALWHDPPGFAHRGGGSRAPSFVRLERIKSRSPGTAGASRP
jgi:hypothetical protein